MTRLSRVTHKFVDTIPRDLEDATLYVSIEYATAVHKCCCGCGREVVTPLTPTDWILTFDGETVSLYPSIGNWSYPCQSHYWIERGQVRWARKWTKSEIAAGRALDQQDKDIFYGAKETPGRSEGATGGSIGKVHPSWFWKWWNGR